MSELFNLPVTDGVPLLLFIPLALLLIASAIGVVVSRNLIYGVLSLVLHLLLVAVVYAAQSASFLFSIQIVVYAGAIVVLFLFVVMLLNIKEEDHILLESPIKIIALISVLSIFLVALTPYYFDEFSKPKTQHALYSENLSKSTNDEGKVASDKAFKIGSAESVGQSLFVEHSFEFELCSALLMAALVGSVLLARRRVSPSQTNS